MPSGVVPAIVLTLLAGGIIGLVNGILITKVRIDSFIATLGMSSVLLALIAWVSSSQQIIGLGSSFEKLGTTEIFGLTLPVPHLLRSGVATVLMMVVLHQLPEAANFAGLALHIAVGTGVYAAALAVFYARTLFHLWIVRAHQPLQS